MVQDIRAALGRPPLPQELLEPLAYQFVSCDVGGLHAAYPVTAPVTLDGGGMNTVLRSWDLFAGRELAVRKHHPAASAVEELLRGLRDALVRERLGTLARHPVIQRFWASGLIDGERCDIFDFAPGMSLSRYVLRNGLTYGILLDIGIHAARGLQHLHRNGLVHADVKPENLCVEEREGMDGESVVRLHLIDFDIVSSPEEQVNQYSLGNGLEGTLPYMPPENFSQRIPADPETARKMALTKDVFALGLTLYRIVTGGFPKNFSPNENALLKSKIRKEEPILEFKERVPEALCRLISEMCRSLWPERPAIEEVIARLRALEKSSTATERSLVLARPRRDLPLSRPRAPEPVEARVGPYRVVRREYARRSLHDGQSLPLAELVDPFGRKLIGVPYAFSNEDLETLFYEERRTLLADLNAVRLLHPELFPGGFRDLVRERSGDEHRVWIIRPLLDGVRKLDEYLKEVEPRASVKFRVAILRRVAEALAILEAAGYALPRLTSELVFFIPRPGEQETLAPEEAALTRPLGRLFDLPAAGEGTPYRQELMGMASARRIRPDVPSPLVDDLLTLAREIGVLAGLGAEDRRLLEQLPALETWRERAEVLVLVEMQC